MADEEKSLSSGDNENKQDKSLEASEADTETSEGDEPEKTLKAVPYDRFKQINDQKKQAESIVNWYRQNIGDPNDVVAFKQWQKAQVKQAEDAEDEGDLSPAKLTAIRKLMRTADPEYKALLERDAKRTQDEEKREKVRIDGQFDDAEEEVRKFADEEIGIPKKNERATSFFAQQVMMTIKNDEKLSRMWDTGNMKCVSRACKIVQDEYVGVLRKTSSASKSSNIADKRRISRLPTLPSGGNGVTSGADKRGPEDKGITKKTHEDAWAYFQSLRE